MQETGFKGPNNLMYISAGSVLNSRWITMGRHSYMRRFLDKPEDLQRLGIYIKNGVPTVRIYEVIDGLAFAERKSDHMLAGYQEELASLRNTLKEAEILLGDLSKGMPRERRVKLELLSFRTSKRIENIQAIIADHAFRQVNLHFAFERAVSRLNEMAVLLERIVYHVRTRTIRVGAIQVVTNRILSELPFFNSKEIRLEVNSAKLVLSEISRDEDKHSVATWLTSEKLQKTADYLFTASSKLLAAALDVPEEEKRSAREILTFGP